MAEIGSRKRKVENLNSQQDDRIVLNVGGKRFETHRTTLLNIPCSMLSERFSTRNSSMNLPDEKGEYFFDRSPTSFKAILDCYRQGLLPLPERPPAGISPGVWAKELLFWGLAWEEKVPTEQTSHVVLMDIEERRRANRVRFCEIVYEEMKGRMELTDGNHLPVTMRIHNLVVVTQFREENMHRHLDEVLPFKPIPPERMKDSDIVLYKNMKYWTMAFIWFQIKSVKPNEKGSPTILLRPLDEKCDEENSAKHFRDIWERMGVQINIGLVTGAACFSNEREYPENLWVDRNAYPMEKRLDTYWHTIKLSVKFKSPA